MNNTNHFDTAAKTWDNEETIRRNDVFGAAIKKYLPDQVARSFLDFGCGTGLLGRPFAEESKSLLGIDTAEGMLEQFNLRYGPWFQVNSLAINLEKSELDSSFGPFDVVMTAMAFHHLKEPVKMLDRFKRYLAPNGLIFIIDLDEEDGTFHPDNQGMGVQHFGFSKAQYEEWANELGLKLMAHEIIYHIEKNNRQYGIGMAVFKV